MSMMKKFKKFIYKFRKQNSNGYISFSNTTTPATGVQIGNFGYTNSVLTTGTGDAVADTRIVRKPVDVFNEILIEKPIISLDNLDEQIKIVKRRIRILTEQSVPLSDEHAAVKYLEARKKYKKYGNLFTWALTTQEKINDLCRTYKVQLVSFAGYAKNVPNEALDELEKFAAAYEKITDDQPYLQLIVDYEGPEHRKDPILLARSPFGNWFYVLGAWDKEVEIVDDLIYKGK